LFQALCRYYSGNGWWRLSVYFTTSAAGFFAIGLSDSATYTGSVIGFNSYAGDGTSGARGAQKQGSYPTSYIPTYGTSQTRSADATLTDTQNLLVLMLIKL
jgi:hypothetical protein